MMVPDSASFKVPIEHVIPPRSTWAKGPEWHVRVMGVVEGWVVMRKKGAMPFLLHINDFLKTYKRIEQPRR